MTTFFVYHDGFQTAINAPDVPGRICIELESLDQPERSVRMRSEYSSNGKWGKEAKWVPAEYSRRSLSNACYTMLQFFEQVHSGLGLISPTHLGFDYSNDGMFIHRIVVASPPGRGVISSTIGARGWPEFDEYVYRVRHQSRRVGVDIDAEPFYKLPEGTYATDALERLLIRLLKARIRLLAGMRVAVSSGWVDLRRVIRERGDKRLQKFLPAHVGGADCFAPKLPRLDETYELAEFVQSLYQAIGLEAPRAFEFDYQGDPNAPEFPVVERPPVRRVILRAPVPVTEHTSNIDLAKTCWRQEFTAYEIGWCPDTAKTDDNPDVVAGLRYAAEKLRRAKFYLTAGMRVPGDINASDLSRIIAERATRYAERKLTKSKAAA